MKTDANGYLNPNKPLDDSYILAIGSSTTNAKEVQQGTRYTDILDEKMRTASDKIYVYNLSQDGFYLPDMVKHFPAMLEEFPNSDSIILEVGSIFQTPEEINACLNQVSLDPQMTGPNIVANLPIMTKIKCFIKDVFTISSLANKQLISLTSSQPKIFNYLKSPEKSQETVHTAEEYQKGYDKMLSLIKSEYSNPIYIIYRSQAELLPDGNIKLICDDQLKYLINSCKKYNIKYVDTSQAILHEYAINHTLPYGFLNTQPGKGHLNKHGHQIFANELYKALTEAD